jgi:hypothetical protein
MHIIMGAIYQRVVENVRLGEQIVQRHVLSLGEMNGTQVKLRLAPS